jgi:predicted YcjX-like family ATPase
MLKAKIKTHKLGTQYTQPHFFILNKGNNSGKPLPEYCSNCFVFLADDLNDKEFHFFIFQGLWELRFFQPYITGSVIPFIRLEDLITVVEETLNAVNTGERTFEDLQKTLSQIEEAKTRLQTKLNYLITIRKSIFYSYLKKK